MPATLNNGSGFDSSLHLLCVSKSKIVARMFRTGFRPVHNAQNDAQTRGSEYVRRVVFDGVVRGKIGLALHGGKFRS